jgi:hypothetical protein
VLATHRLCCSVQLRQWRLLLHQLLAVQAQALALQWD